MSASISHQIKRRKKANDVFITPIDLAKKHIDMIDFNEDDIWLDPCRNSGNYYNQYPTKNKDWCEILDGKDFFDYRGKVDICCSNPPYSLLNKWIEKHIELNPRVISFLIGIGNLTTKRIETLERAGYSLTKLKMMKVYSWYGMSCIVVFEKNKESIIEFDRKIYRLEEHTAPPPYVEVEKKQKKIRFKIKAK